MPPHRPVAWDRLPSELSLEPCSWDLIPNEIICTIVSQLDFSPRTLANLRAVNKRIRGVLDNYEWSLAKEIASKQFPDANERYPGLAALDRRGKQSHSYAWLSEIHRRQGVVRQLRKAFRRETCMAPVDSSRAMANAFQLMMHHQCPCRFPTYAAEAGILLLYRFQDLESYEEKATLLRTLPYASLAVLFFALILARITASRSGAGPINRIACPVMNSGDRFQYELAFMEEILDQGGVDFLYDSVIKSSDRAAQTLRRAYDDIDKLEADPDSPPSLMSILNNTLARRQADFTIAMDQEAQTAVGPNPGMIQTVFDLGNGSHLHINVPTIASHPPLQVHIMDLPRLIAGTIQEPLYRVGRLTRWDLADLVSGKGLRCEGCVAKELKEQGMTVDRGRDGFIVVRELEIDVAQEVREIEAEKLEEGWSKQSLAGRWGEGGLCGVDDR